MVWAFLFAKTGLDPENPGDIAIVYLGRKEDSSYLQKQGRSSK